MRHRAAALEALSLTVKIWTGALMVAGALWVGHIAYEAGAPERERLAKVQAEFDVLPREVKERGREFACRRSYKSHDYVQNCIDRGDWGQMYRHSRSAGGRYPGVDGKSCGADAGADLSRAFAIAPCMGLARLNCACLGTPILCGKSAVSRPVKHFSAFRWPPPHLIAGRHRRLSVIDLPQSMLKEFVATHRSSGACMPLLLWATTAHGEDYACLLNGLRVRSLSDRQPGAWFLLVGVKTFLGGPRTMCASRHHRRATASFGLQFWRSATKLAACDWIAASAR